LFQKMQKPFMRKKGFKRWGREKDRWKYHDVWGKKKSQARKKGECEQVESNGGLGGERTLLS